MKTKTTKSTAVTKVSEEEFLSQIAEKLKGKTLFPHKVAAAREYLQNVKINTR